MSKAFFKSIKITPLRMPLSILTHQLECPRCYGCGQSLKPGGLPQDRIASILKMVDNLSLLMCLQFITTSTFTVSTQSFLAFNPTFAKCPLTSCHSFRQSTKKWLPTGWAFCFRLFAGNCCSFFFVNVRQSVFLSSWLTEH